MHALRAVCAHAAACPSPSTPIARAGPFTRPRPAGPSIAPPHAGRPGPRPPGHRAHRRLLAAGPRAAASASTARSRAASSTSCALAGSPRSRRPIPICASGSSPTTTPPSPGRPPIPPPAFVPLGDVDLDQILCEQADRIVGQDNVVTLDGVRLQLAKQPGRPTCAGLRVIVRRHLDGSTASGAARAARPLCPRRRARSRARGTGPRRALPCRRRPACHRVRSRRVPTPRSSSPPWPPSARGPRGVKPDRSLVKHERTHHLSTTCARPRRRRVQYRHATLADRLAQINPTVGDLDGNVASDRAPAIERARGAGRRPAGLPRDGRHRLPARGPAAQAAFIERAT